MLPALVDGLRPITAALWADLPLGERNRFLRHLRPFWDVHRHRMAPKVADGFTALRETGVLTLRRGRVKEIALRDGCALVTLQDRGANRCDTIAVQRVIYATGTGAGTAVPDIRIQGRVIGQQIAEALASPL